MENRVRNILLNFQKKYTGKDNNGEMPYYDFNAIDEHISENKEVVWGQFTSGKKRKIASATKIKELKKNGGFAFFISDDKNGGTRLFYGKILNVYENFRSNEEEIDISLIPNYYKEQYITQKEGKELSYNFEVALWLKLEFFKELDLSILDYFFSESNEKNSIAKTRRRRSIYMSYVNISPEIKISTFENVSVMRRAILEYGCIIPPLWIENSLIGLKDKSITTSEGKNVISLFNEKSLNIFEDFFIGQEIVNNFNIQKDYKPYIYEFVTKENISEFEDGNAIEVYSRLDVESPNFKISRNELVAGEITFCASPKKNVEAFIKVSPSRSNKRIRKLKNQLKGYLLTTDYIMRNRSDEIEINDIKNAKNIIEKNIKINSDLSQVTIDIHNVGNGNFIKIKMNDNNSNESTVYFDVGYGKGSNVPKQISDNIDAVFLSHWDTDHIHGALEILDANKHVMWFAPRMNRQSGSNFYNLLVCTLLIRNRLRMFSFSFSNKLIYQNNGISLYKGSGKGGTAKVENSLGLILELECGGKNILLTGDCEYEYLPKKIINNKYNYLVVPHHGSNTVKAKFKVPIKSRTTTTRNYKINSKHYQIVPFMGTAIISCKANRADEDHINCLKNNSFNVVETNADKIGICIELP